MAESTTATVRFLVISDTHDFDFDLQSPSSDLKRGFRNDKIPLVDVVLHCGDLTENGGIENYEKVIRMLSSIDAELKLVIAGNHDLSLDNNFNLKHTGNADEHEQAMSLWNGTIAKDAGIAYLDEEIHRFTLKSGATFTVFASPWTPAYGESALQHPSCHDRYNRESPACATNVATDKSLIPAFPAIDIAMTHGPPKYILDDTGNRNNGGCEHLRRAVCQAKPRLHCFGHIHGGWGAQKVGWKDDERQSTQSLGEEDRLMAPLPKEFTGKNSSRKRGYATVHTDGMQHGRQTLFVNAAIRDGEESNAPWLIKLDLPLASSEAVRGGVEGRGESHVSVSGSR